MNKSGKETTLRSACSINYFVEIMGDKWSLLILRDIIFWGKINPSQFRTSDEHIATNILSARLVKLIDADIIQKNVDPVDKRREKYHLTERGMGVVPILLNIMTWSNTFGPDNLKLSKALINDFRDDPIKVVSEIETLLQAGSYIFSRKEWQPQTNNSDING